jgi:hypothetical protein
VYLCLVGCSSAEPEAPQHETAPLLERILTQSSLYHLDAGGNALNLDVSDNTFRFGADMCDAQEYSQGRIEAQPDGLLRLSADTPFQWPIWRDEDSLIFDSVDLVEVIEVLDGQIVIRVDGSSEQGWSAGGVCPVCPEGLNVTACDTPFLGLED